MAIPALIYAALNAGGPGASGWGVPMATDIVFALGVILGLVVGKPLGIFLTSWLAVRSRLADLPQGVRWSHIHGAGWLGGIGFTMSLFVAGLAFPDATLLTSAKLGILAASMIAGVTGYLLLARAASQGASNRA